MSIRVAVGAPRLAECVSLLAVGPELSVDAELSLEFNHGLGPVSAGRVVQVADYGARPVIETEGQRWWLRPVASVRFGTPHRDWEVGGMSDGN